MKKEPFKRYVKETGRKPITAVMACESRMREQQYYQQGCNAYTSKTNPISMPMAFWRDTDVWEYLRKHKIMYSRIYDMGEVRTGCIFCAFGAHLEKSPNRFQRLAISHPQLHAYCMDKLGFRGVLDLIGVETGD